MTRYLDAANMDATTLTGDAGSQTLARAAHATPMTLVGCPSIELRLMRGFQLALDGRPASVSANSQRLLAFLALQDRPVRRAYIAGMLWSGCDSTRSNGNLRSALWRLTDPGRALVQAIGQTLQLAPTVAVDARRTEEIARFIDDADGPAATLAIDALDELLGGGELLPDWYEEWVTFERERLRQLRLHALERLCVNLTEAGRFDRALQCGLAALREDPLRESAHRAIIAVHIAEGNLSEAIRQYGLCRDLMARELAVEPSPATTSLIRGGIGQRVAGAP